MMEIAINVICYRYQSNCRRIEMKKNQIGNLQLLGTLSQTCGRGADHEPHWETSVCI